MIKIVLDIILCTLLKIIKVLECKDEFLILTMIKIVLDTIVLETLPTPIVIILECRQYRANF